MSYYNKYIDYVNTIIKTFAPIYIHRTTYKKKWQKILNKNSKNSLIEWLDFDEKSSTSITKEIARYFNKRKRQFSKVAKILIKNSNFVTATTKLLKKWQLRNIVYGFESTPFYDSEYRNIILNLWKCALNLIDFKKILKDKEFLLNLINEEQENIYKKNLPSARFNKDIEKLMDSFNLSLIWKDSIILLLLTGYFPLPTNFCPIIFKIEDDKPGLSIPIYPETQIEDIRYKWGEVKKLKEEIFGKRRIKPSKDFDNFLDIYLKKEKTHNSYRELIDFDKYKIPYGIVSEKKGFERLRKGSQSIAKLSEKLVKTKLNNPQYINELEEIIGLKSHLFIF